MIRILIKKAQNYLLKKLVYINTIHANEKTVYLTFDDGPEPGITEFVLEELAKYNYKATFFCRGDNAEENSELLEVIRKHGHSIANHTYSHLHAYKASATLYLANVGKADAVLHTNLFRPPHGSLTIKTWLGLRGKYHIVYWSLNSGDCDGEAFKFQKSIESLKAKTKPGDVVLFHFCHKHEKETCELLPMYLEWLYANGYHSAAITIKTNKTYYKNAKQ